MHEHQSPREEASQLHDHQKQAVPEPEPAEEPGQPEHHERSDLDRPQIWVGSWLDYNNGILHGDWIPADRGDADVWADIRTILGRSPTAGETGEVAEDWGIFDYENFGSLRIGEQETVAWVTTVARGITEHGPAFAAYAEVMDDEQRLEGFADSYLGHFDSADAYVEHLIDESGYPELLDEALPDSIRGYTRIDTAALARDMQLSGDIHVIRAEDGGVWIFRA